MRSCVFYPIQFALFSLSIRNDFQFCRHRWRRFFFGLCSHRVTWVSHPHTHTHYETPSRKHTFAISYDKYLCRHILAESLQWQLSSTFILPIFPPVHSVPPSISFSVLSSIEWFARILLCCIASYCLLIHELMLFLSFSLIFSLLCVCQKSAFRAFGEHVCPSHRQTAAVYTIV